MSTKTEKAMEYFNSGFSCAQSVFAPFSEDYDLDTEMALRVAGALGGGCNSAELCGAVSGAALVIGLKYGQYIEGDSGAKANSRAKITEFTDAFRAEFNSVVCRGLLGFDLTTPEGHEQYVAMVREESPCAGFVRRAVGLLEEFGY